VIALERRDATGWTARFAAYAIALGMGFGVSAILMAASGASVSEGFGVLYEGAFGSGEAVLQSLVAATPLIFTGLATVIAFRARIWSIGQEGQMFAGAMGGYWASLYLDGLPSMVSIPLIILAAIFCGGTLSAFSGWLKTRFGLNEIISTVMMNYIVIYFLSYLLAGGPWTELGTTSYHRTPILADNFQLPLITSAAKLHIGFVLALVSALICYLIIEKTPLRFFSLSLLLKIDCGIVSLTFFIIDIMGILVFSLIIFAIISV
jgi:simple sugar transport system permease protein